MFVLRFEIIDLEQVWKRKENEEEDGEGDSKRRRGKIKSEIRRKVR